MGVRPGVADAGTHSAVLTDGRCDGRISVRVPPLPSNVRTAQAAEPPSSGGRLVISEPASTATG
jgi:hypothetical protein